MNHGPQLRDMWCLCTAKPYCSQLKASVFKNIFWLVHRLVWRMTAEEAVEKYAEMEVGNEEKEIPSRLPKFVRTPSNLLVQAQQAQTKHSVVKELRVVGKLMLLLNLLMFLWGGGGNVPKAGVGRGYVNKVVYQGHTKVCKDLRHFLWVYQGSWGWKQRTFWHLQKGRRRRKKLREPWCASAVFKVTNEMMSYIGHGSSLCMDF